MRFIKIVLFFALLGVLAVNAKGQCTFNSYNPQEQNGPFRPIYSTSINITDHNNGTVSITSNTKITKELESFFKSDLKKKTIQWQNIAKDSVKYQFTDSNLVLIKTNISRFCRQDWYDDKTIFKVLLVYLNETCTCANYVYFMDDESAANYDIRSLNEPADMLFQEMSNSKNANILFFNQD